MKVIAQHRNSWQAIGGIVESKANLTTYCLEVARQLEIRFSSPSLPVDLTLKENGLDGSLEGDANDSPPPLDANTGPRHRRGKSRFEELVQTALEANKDK